MHPGRVWLPCAVLIGALLILPMQLFAQTVQLKAPHSLRKADAAFRDGLCRAAERES